MRGAAPAETVMRSTGAPEAPTAPIAPAGESAQPRKRIGVVAIVIAAVIAVGGGAAAISATLGGGSSGGSGQAAPIAQQPDDDFDEVIDATVQPPDLVSAIVQPNGEVEISWSPGEGSTANLFRWAQISGGDAVSAPDAATMAILPASESGAPVCIQVWAIEQGAQSVAPLEACAP
jgi:hypothetical protein